MAFRTPTPQLAAESAMYAARHAGGLRSSHADNVADLLKLATAPADANAVLAAVHKWRAGQKEHRLFWRTAALLLVMSGDRPEDVCAGLGFGRTALQQVAGREPTLADFRQFLYRARPKRKEAA
ncbi:hypothetical protein [Mycobacteroides abscessus]|uniref:hypothetical protein n=1 Tax=Mycobacteroides abscessus TaxID=36809 RepID=UPI0009267CB2|nr:hypothetical protein [Mycobacteroides abscessus]MBE5451239.1 hypothetical protein [Mycobacteroides abscessus]MDO3352106.1 hypothetical protein [Mycobacteroides abscessus subsp. abscessus]PVA12457.1 hypothetical protein DDJ61_22965 [Mycobacteroides abscessus]PVA74368.1 hypothetical protein DDJ76_22340 [Mycobacteroides abscessus]RIR90320.1 hypothetical protein D2E50_15345 [Mycobacteroides abscessus]